MAFFKSTFFFFNKEFTLILKMNILFSGILSFYLVKLAFLLDLLRDGHKCCGSGSFIGIHKKTPVIQIFSLYKIV